MPTTRKGKSQTLSSLSCHWSQTNLVIPGWLTVFPPIITAIVAIVFRYSPTHPPTHPPTHSLFTLFLYQASSDSSSYWHLVMCFSWLVSRF